VLAVGEVAAPETARAMGSYRVKVCVGTLNPPYELMAQMPAQMDTVVMNDDVEEK